MDESLRKSISISWTKYYLRRVRERIQQNGFHDFLVGKNTTFRVFSDRVILRVDREEIVLQRGRGVIKMELKERIDDETIYDWEFMIEPSPDRENPLNFQFQLNETPNQVALFTILRRVLKIKSKTLGKNLLPEWHHGSW